MRPKLNLRAAMARVSEHQAADMTFAELADAYTAVHFNGIAYRLKKWQDAFGHLSAWTITTRDISLAAEAMIQSGHYKPSSVNRDLSSVGMVFKWAIARHLAPVGFISPTIAIPRYTEEIRRVELTDREVSTLLKGAVAHRDRRFAVYVRLMIETGARRSEVAERRWNDVDLDAGTITVLETKTKKPRTLFFSPGTADLLRRVWPSKRPPDELLFESKIRGQAINYRAAWAKLTKAIGRPDLHLHDLRHHRAAEMLRSGVTLAVAAQVLGHSSLILQRRYGHLENATLREAAEQSWRTAA